MVLFHKQRAEELKLIYLEYSFKRSVEDTWDGKTLDLERSIYEIRWNYSW